MKILFQIRKDYLKNIAGDSIVFLNIRQELMDLGLKVDVCTEHNIYAKNYDLVHIFNTIRVKESYEFMKNAKKYNKKVVLTPIYWDLRDFYRATNQWEKLRAWEKSEHKRKYLFENCDVFLPHCYGEAELICRNYGIANTFAIVPYGVDPNFAKGSRHFLQSRYGVDEYILCVGRIHHQKNQLNLIKALSKENIPIVLVGSVNDKEYYDDCLRAAKNNVLFLNNIKREELKSVYKSARVHVLPSWIEYPGLASLEAGMADCNVVSTEIGSTKEVLKGFVKYCNPGAIASIHSATMEAFESPKSSQLKEYIFDHYLWKETAKKIQELYAALL